MAQQKKSTIGNKKADSDWKFRSGIKIKDYLLYRIQIDLHIVIEPTKMASKDFFFNWHSKKCFNYFTTISTTSVYKKFIRFETLWDISVKVNIQSRISVLMRFLKLQFLTVN